MFWVFLLNTLIVAVVVLIHYEFLIRINTYINGIATKHRVRILIGVFAALIVHALEVWVFAIAYFGMEHWLGWGHLQGVLVDSLMDYSYFSFTTYTSLGFGDLLPVGQLRYLAGIEALTGLVMISWSASFLYIEMQKYWDIKD